LFQGFSMTPVPGGAGSPGSPFALHWLTASSESFVHLDAHTGSGTTLTRDAIATPSHVATSSMAFQSECCFASNRIHPRKVGMRPVINHPPSGLHFS
jgi:hypothetical protein